jgi:hypothetical protein
MCLRLLQAALQSKGIVPSNTVRYPKADVEAAIKAMYGVGARAHCDYHGHLSEVRAA